MLHSTMWVVNFSIYGLHGHIALSMEELANHERHREFITLSGLRRVVSLKKIGLYIFLLFLY